MPVHEFSPLHHDVQGGWRGYWDTDGRGRAVFCQIEPAVGPYGVSRTELEQLRRDAPPANNGNGKRHAGTGGTTENQRKYILYRAKIIDLLCNTEHVVVSEAAEYAGCSHRRARTHLDRLVDEGLADCTSTGARTYWWVA